MGEVWHGEEKAILAEFSADFQRVLIATENDVEVWNTATGQPASPPIKHKGPVYHVAFTPDGGRVVIVSSDQTARVWDAVSGQPVSPPLKHNGLVRVAWFSPDGRRVVTASDDHTARVWD